MGKIGSRQLKKLEHEGYEVKKSDLQKLRKDLDNDLKKQGQKESSRETLITAMGAVKHGFDNIADSINTPYTKKRVKIAQLPPNMHSIGHNPGTKKGKDDFKDLSGSNRKASAKMGSDGFGNMDLSSLRNPRFGKSLRKK